MLPTHPPSPVKLYPIADAICKLTMQHEVFKQSHKAACFPLLFSQRFRQAIYIFQPPMQ